MLIRTFFLLVSFLLINFVSVNDLHSQAIHSVAKKKTGLNWYSQDQLSTSATGGYQHGKKKDLPVVANWNDTDSAVVVHASGKKASAALQWQLYSATAGVQSFNFGTKKQGVLAGIDLDQSGSADIAVISTNRIIVRLDPFTVASGIGTAEHELSFAKSTVEKGFPVVFNPESDQELIGFLTVEELNGLPRYFLTLRDLAGNLRRLDIPGVASREVSEAYGLQLKDGKDALLIFSKQNKQVEVTVLLVSGTVIYRNLFRGRFTTAVGDFAEDAGEEFVLQKGRRLRVINPVTKSVTKRTLAKGKIVDGILAVGKGKVKSIASDDSSGNGSGGGSGICDKFLPAPDGLNNFLAKNSDHGGIVYLTPNGSYRDGKILHHKTLKVLQATRYTGVANGGRGHFRISGSLPFGPHVFSAVTGNQTHCWRIPDGMSRVD